MHYIPIVFHWEGFKFQCATDDSGFGLFFLHNSRRHSCQRYFLKDILLGVKTLETQFQYLGISVVSAIWD